MLYPDYIPGNAISITKYGNNTWKLHGASPSFAEFYLYDFNVYLLTIVNSSLSLNWTADSKIDAVAKRDKVDLEHGGRKGGEV